MLTAIRDFVRDSFGSRQVRQLDGLRIGDLTVYIAAGPSCDSRGRRSRHAAARSPSERRGSARSDPPAARCGPRRVQRRCGTVRSRTADPRSLPEQRLSARAKGRGVRALDCLRGPGPLGRDLVVVHVSGAIGSGVRTWTGCRRRRGSSWSIPAVDRAAITSSACAIRWPPTRRRCWHRRACRSIRWTARLELYEPLQPGARAGAGEARLASRRRRDLSSFGTARWSASGAATAQWIWRERAARADDCRDFPLRCTPASRWPT